MKENKNNALQNQSSELNENDLESVAGGICCDERYVSFSDNRLKLREPMIQQPASGQKK